MQIHKDQKETCYKINDMPSPEVTLLHLNASGPCHRHHGPYPTHYTCVHDTRKQGSHCPAHTPNHKSWPLLPSTYVSLQTMASTSSYIQFTANHNPYLLKYAPTTATDTSLQSAHPIARHSPHSPAQAHQCQPQLLSLSAGTLVQLVIPIPQHLPQQTTTATPCPNIQPKASHSPIPQIIRPTAHRCP